MRPVQLLAVSVLALSANAHAASFDSLDLFYTSAELTLEGRTDSNAGTVGYRADIDSLDGFGAKFRGSVADDFFFSGEWQRLKAEHSGLILSDPGTGASIESDGQGSLSYSEWRLGLGLPFYRARSLTVYGLVEYVDTELKTTFEAPDPDSGAPVSNAFKDEQKGAAAHAGALFNPTRAWSVYGQIGYLHLEDLDGLEYLVGTALQVHRYGGLFAEYRNSDLDGGADRQAELTPWRAGLYLLVQ